MASNLRVTAQFSQTIGRVVSDDGTPSLDRIRFRVLPGSTTTAGRMIGLAVNRADNQPAMLLGRVQALWEVNPHEDPQSSTVADVIPMETRYAPEGRSTVIYRCAEAELVEELLLDNDGRVATTTSPQTLPLAGTEVVEVPPEVLAPAFGLAEGASVGLHVGSMVGRPDVPVALKRNVIQTHMFLAGGIGRGKSYARGVLAEELAAHGIPQINIDPLGEMVEATDDLGGCNVIPGAGFHLPLSALEADDILDAIPGINRSTNIATLIAYAHNRLLSERVLRGGSHFGVSDLVQEIENVAPVLDMNAANTKRPASQRAQSLERIDFLGDPYPWEKELVPGRIINIDCRGRLVHELRLIAASVARDIQRLAKARRIPFVVLSIDEAHLIAPNNDAVVTTQVLREIARIGRHYRIGLVLTTQSPADLDRSILKRLLTRFIFAIEPDQLDSLRGIFSDAPKAITSALPKLAVGTCLVTGVSETIKHAALIKIRERVTRIGGQTPDVFGDLAAKGWNGRVDVTRVAEAVRSRINARRG